MRIYNYDPESRYLLGTSLADPDPVVEAAITERAKRIAEASANELATREAKARGLELVLPFPRAEDPNEIEPMKQSFLLPAHCTAVAPPENIPDGHAAMWLDDAWTVVELPKAPIPTSDGGEVSADFVAADFSVDRVEAEHQAWVRKVIRAHMDTIARSAGYHDIAEMVSYADEPAVPKFQAEGQAARRWRSLFREAALTKIAETLPETLAELLDGLPEYQPPTPTEE